MDELLAELREHERDFPGLIHGPLCGNAADVIERLQKQQLEREEWKQAWMDDANAEIERLRAFYNEAVTTLENRNAEIERLRTEIIRHGWWKYPPCLICGYNSHSYYQPEFHDCARRALEQARKG
jgi:hypothetical protein